MTKQDLMAYILETPGNTNPAILSQKIDEYANENSASGEEGDDYLILRLNLTDEVIENIIHADYAESISLEGPFYKAEINRSFEEIDSNYGEKNIFMICEQMDVGDIYYLEYYTQLDNLKVYIIDITHMSNNENYNISIFEDEAFYCIRGMTDS